MARFTLLLIISIPLLLLGLIRYTYLTPDIEQKTLVNYEVEEPYGSSNQPENLASSGLDGPHLFWQGDSLRVVEVNASSQVKQTLIKPDKETLFTTYVANKDGDAFSFRLQPNPVPPVAIYKQPKKVLAISDIEGNFNAFYSLLIGNGVMDETYRWTFGDGHLVLVGDFVDRGDNVTQCLWLIYKLEQEAPKHGGLVHYILGNHEVMNLEYDMRYVNKKYLTLAQQISGKASVSEAYPYLMSDDNVLVQWMRTKNCIEKIGDVLYVHGGISPELLATKMTIDEINDALRSRIRLMPDEESNTDEKSAIVIGGAGPLWYRGLVKKDEGEYGKTPRSTVNQALRYFKVKKITIGHSLVPEVSTDFNGKVIRIDIQQPQQKRTGKAQGLLIEDGTAYRINDLGQRTLLPKR